MDLDNFIIGKQKRGEERGDLAKKTTTAYK